MVGFCRRKGKGARNPRKAPNTKSRCTLAGHADAADKSAGGSHTGLWVVLGLVVAGGGAYAWKQHEDSKPQWEKGGRSSVLPRQNSRSSSGGGGGYAGQQMKPMRLQSSAHEAS